MDEHVSHAGACKMLMLSTPTPVSRVPQVRNMDAVAKWFSPHILAQSPVTRHETVMEMVLCADLPAPSSHALQI